MAAVAMWATAVVLIGRVGGLASPELPYVSAADRPWRSVLRLVIDRPLGGFYTVAIRTWMTFGRSEGWLRLLSAAFALGALAVVAALVDGAANLGRWRPIVVISVAGGLVGPSTRIEPTTAEVLLVVLSVAVGRRVLAGTRRVEVGRVGPGGVGPGWAVCVWLGLAVAMVGVDLALLVIVVAEAGWYAWWRAQRPSAADDAVPGHGRLGLILAPAFGLAGLASFAFVRPTDWAPATRLVFTTAAPGDSIVFVDGRSRLAFEYYRTRYGVPPASLPTPTYPLQPWGGFGLESLTGERPGAPTLERVRDTARRVWVIAPSRRYAEAVEVAHRYPSPRVGVRFGAAYVFRYDFAATR